MEIIKSDKETGNKIKILFKGWINVPHSYACVNCFQLVHLYKNHYNLLDIYVEEAEYFRKEWNNVKTLVYTEEYNNILKNLKQYNGEQIDIVYNITYPYDVTPIVINGKIIPKCVFYTSEFATLDNSYFSINKMGFGTTNDVINHLNKNNKLYFTSPSKWSAQGLKNFNISDNKNRIITHGVDTTIMKKNDNIEQRKAIRKFYNIKDDDILLLNIGAMTQNKGIVEIILALNNIINKMKITNFKLILKGTGDLYQSRQFLELYFENLLKTNQLTTDEKNNLLNNHIIFLEKTFMFSRINDLYNASDLYILPYLAEGFGLVPLECLASGLSVLVPKTGSTKEYIEDIYKNGGEHFINYVDSEVIMMQNGFLQNQINIDAIVKTLLEFNNKKNTDDTLRNNNYLKMASYIDKNYSWNTVSDLLYDYIKYIVDENNSE